MNSFDSLEEKPVPCEVPKKRGRTLSCHKREIKKKKLYSAGGTTHQIGCDHRSQNSSSILCQANLTAEDILFNVDKFYKVPNKVHQNQIILNLLLISNS